MRQLTKHSPFDQMDGVIVENTVVPLMTGREMDVMAILVLDLAATRAIALHWATL